MAAHPKPRCGSLGFSPRKRAKRIFVSPRKFPESEKLGIQGFAAYKAGMTHIITTGIKEASSTYGRRLSVPVTILECPPMFVAAIRAYKKTVKGLVPFSEVWAQKLPKRLKQKGGDFAQIEKNADKIHELRAIIATQPSKIKLKHTPELLELKISGKDMNEKVSYAKELLGKETAISDVFAEGDIVDVLAVTKGKGLQGVVKRWHVSIQTRKAHGYRRHVGSMGAWTPSKMVWRVPQGGQMGFHRRTEYNKQIVKIGADGKEVTPKGGFVRYGEVGNYLILAGSIPGPKKRLVTLRPAIRPPLTEQKLPSIDLVSTVSQQ